MMRSVGKRNIDKLSGKGTDVGKSVFSENAYPVIVHGNTPGGLIDKRQQVDPGSTTFGHPFDGGDYKTTTASKPVSPKTNFNVIYPLNPLTQQVPEIMPHERGAFFQRKVAVPIVKTQFGANASGAKSDTSFHKTKKRIIQPAPLKSARTTEKVVNHGKVPSFSSSSNLWSHQNQSFSAGTVNPLTGTRGVGRWQTVKRSVV